MEAVNTLITNQMMLPAPRDKSSSMTRQMHVGPAGATTQEQVGAGV